MVTRIGHMALRTPDLDAAVEFQCDVLGLVEVERRAGVAYLTANERHHELMLIQDDRGGYDHVALEVADAAALEEAKRRIPAAGGELLGDVYDGEPGIDRALRFTGPGGHVFKLFCGMETVDAPPPGDRPRKFEHVSLKVARLGRMERFLRDALGFRFSDRMGPFASWWHCDADHHGIALVLAPRSELAHSAWAFDDFGALGRVADRLAERRRKLVWGPSRHGPGNNHFIYFKDADDSLIECCSELAQMAPAGDYQPREWPIGVDTINQWGGRPPLEFLRAGTPVAPPERGRPAWAVAEARQPAVA
jgi:catechol 2,3-dioxygenase-like lactoylglutathione lyase family enzyme